MKLRIDFDFRVGRVVKYFILADLALLAGWGLVDPVFSVFIIGKVEGATLVSVGTAAAIYWFLKSILQLPLANALILGLFIASLSAFGFAFVRSLWQLYFFQVFHSLGFALYAASWPAIFSRHLDRDRVSFDWALDSTAVGVSAGASGFLGGVIAQNFGFSVVFILGGLFTAVSALVLLAVPDLVLPPPKASEPVIRDHTPTNIGH
ncbi:MAG: hypothetical protein UY96_C0030G0005 [Parcubacteria group bacterium GW2011_GWB1_56_8]|nr:MAG: hypothetical protein UY96_C0030G0005 [Parcubacteria group bacterium GW2011_GWB1_56_8]